MDRGGFDMGRVTLPYCPCCHQPTRVHEENGVKRLFCDNPDCAARRLRQFVHFAGKKAMNIEGLSEGTLEKLIGWGLLHNGRLPFRSLRYPPERPISAAEAG